MPHREDATPEGCHTGRMPHRQDATPEGCHTGKMPHREDATPARCHTRSDWCTLTQEKLLEMKTRSANKEDPYLCPGHRDCLNNSRVGLCVGTSEIIPGTTCKKRRSVMDNAYTSTHFRSSRQFCICEKNTQSPPLSLGSRHPFTNISTF